MTVRPATPRKSLPDLVLVAHRLVTEEGDALRAALADFSASPQPGCPHQLDSRAWSQDGSNRDRERQRLLDLTGHQARLICVNAYDHLVTLGRVLGGDGAMPVFAHTTLSRVVCEAAVRVAWILDPGIGSEERILRGAVAFLASADERLRGVMSIPTGHFHPQLRQNMIASCTTERDQARKLIADAGVTLVPSGDGTRVTRLELKEPRIRVAVKLDVTRLMTEMLPDSPTWYNISSGVAHSHFWGIRDAAINSGGGELIISPNLMNVGAAVQCAISASALIISRCAEYYGHDPMPHVTRSQKRRTTLDPCMQRIATGRGATA
jgi:hypothetical protein